MKVLDTTFLIDMIHGKKETEKVVESLEPLLTTQINMYEVIRGFIIKKIQQKKFLEIIALFENIRVLPLTDQGIIKASEISAELMKKGYPAPDCDCLIAGIALHNNVRTIITRDDKHFQEIKGLKVEDY